MNHAYDNDLPAGTSAPSEPSVPSTDGTSSFPAVTFEPARAALEELVANSQPMLAATDATSAQLHAARMPLKNARIAIETRRKALVEPALDYQRRVNDAAKELIAIIEPTEKLLEGRQRALEAAERAERERQRRAAFDRADAWAERFRAFGINEPATNFLDIGDDALSARLDIARQAYWEKEQRIAAEREARERAAAEARAQREAEERERAAALEAERQAIAAERARIDAERKAEAAQRAAEARALAEARAREEAKLRAQREALAQQQRELDAARQAAEAAERQRRAAEAAQAAEQARLERARQAAPLAAQVRDLAERVGGLVGPDDARCHAILHGAASDLERYAASLESGEAQQ